MGSTRNDEGPAFAGAALTRRTEYEKWLRQERTQAFATFLKELHDTRLLASKVYYDEAGEEFTKSMKVTEAFTLLQKSLNIARLFMSQPGRDEVSKLATEIWVNCTVQGGPANRVTQTKQLMEQVQAVIERELDYMPMTFNWPFKATTRR